MNNPPILPPEVEKEFDEKYKDAFAGGDMWNWEKGKEVKSFLAKAIAEEVEKAIEEASEILSKKIDHLYEIDTIGSRTIASLLRNEREKIQKLKHQLTPDPLSE